MGDRRQLYLGETSGYRGIPVFNAEQDRTISLKKPFMELMALASAVNQEEQRYVCEEFESNGEMSRVMTVAEKNVWLAKHKIEAIFANEIPLSKDYKTFQYVDDYSQLEDFTNTYQDYANTLHRAKKHTWFNADLLACLDCETMDKEKIERWMQNVDIPQFNKWMGQWN